MRHHLICTTTEILISPQHFLLVNATSQTIFSLRGYNESFLLIQMEEHMFKSQKLQDLFFFEKWFRSFLFGF